MNSTKQIEVKTALETETCSRCSGSGHYSYCQSHGTICFKCGGSGKVYTKRGAAAALYLKGLRSKLATSFLVGDLFYMEGTPGLSSGGFSKVTEVLHITGAELYAQGNRSYINGIEQPQRDQVRITTEKRGSWQGSPDTQVRFALTAQQKLDTLAAALDYQETLTKQGKVSKRKTLVTPLTCH